MPHQVIAIRFVPKLRVLVTGSMDKTVRVWDIQSGKLLHNLVVRPD